MNRPHYIGGICNDPSGAAHLAMVPVLEAAEQAEALLRRKLGTAFRIADYAVGGLEVPLNRILGDLLDPEGLHGQGGAFLKLFLEAMANDLPVGDPKRWLVIPSHRTRRGRYIDLALFRHPDVAIYLESKPWASEGDRQLEDYALDLLELGHKCKRLIFLPGTADRESQSLSPETRQLLGDSGFPALSFQRTEDRPSIVQWLARCAETCDADNVRLFIDDLARYLDAEFPSSKGGKAMSDDPFIAMMMPLVQNSKKYMEIVLKFERMAPQLKRAVARSFFKNLVHELKTRNPGWVVDNNFTNFDRKYERLSFRKESWPEAWGIWLEMGQSDFTDFYIGFSCPSQMQHLKDNGFDSRTPLATEEDRALIASDALKRALFAIGPHVGYSSSWPAYCYLPPPFRHWDAQTFVLLSSLELMRDERTALDTFAGWFRILKDALGTKVDDILMRHTHADSR